VFCIFPFPTGEALATSMIKSLHTYSRLGELLDVHTKVTADTSATYLPTSPTPGTALRQTSNTIRAISTMDSGLTRTTIHMDRLTTRPTFGPNLHVSSVSMADVNTAEVITDSLSKVIPTHPIYTGKQILTLYVTIFLKTLMTFLYKHAVNYVLLILLVMY